MKGAVIDSGQGGYVVSCPSKKMCRVFDLKKLMKERVLARGWAVQDLKTGEIDELQNLPYDRLGGDITVFVITPNEREAVRHKTIIAGLGAIKWGLGAIKCKVVRVKIIQDD